MVYGGGKTRPLNSTLYGPIARLPVCNSIPGVVLLYETVT